MTTTEAPRKTGASLQFIDDTFQIHRTYSFGTKALKDKFGDKVEPLSVPALFSENVLRRAWEMDCCVVLQHSHTEAGTPLTLRHLHDTRGNKDFLGGKFLYNTDWYKELPLFTEQTSRNGLFLKGRSLMPDSTGKTFVGESLIGADFAERLFDNEMPEQYGAAIEELRTGAERLEKLCGRDWQEGARQCVALAFSRFFRESPVEVLYRVLLAQKLNRERLFERFYTRTNALSPDFGVVCVGGSDAGGACVDRWDPQCASDDLGFSFSCSGEVEAVG